MWLPHSLLYFHHLLFPLKLFYRFFQPNLKNFPWTRFLDIWCNISAHEKYCFQIWWLLFTTKIIIFLTKMKNLPDLLSTIHLTWPSSSCSVHHVRFMLNYYYIRKVTTAVQQPCFFNLTTTKLKLFSWSCFLSRFSVSWWTKY